MIQVSGHTAQIMYGYQLAGRVDTWTMQRNDAGAYVLRGTLCNVHPVYIGGRSLSVMVRHQRGVWRWPIVTMSIDRERATIEAVIDRHDAY